jgi:hypothetical protein
MVKIPRKEMRLRNQVNHKFISNGVDFSDDMLIYGNGAGGGILLQPEGLLTADNKFIHYRDIKSIKEKININKDEFLAFGLIGMGFDIANSKTIEIKFNEDKILIGNIRNEEAFKFINSVKDKIRETEDKSKNTTSPVEEIKMAKDLLDDGAITEEEFQIIKEKVLKKL